MLASVTCYCYRIPLTFLPQNQSKSLCALPHVLSLNCQVESEQDRDFWRQQQQQAGGSPWVPLSMELTLDKGNQLGVRELPEEENCTPSADPKVQLFGNH